MQAPIVSNRPERSRLQEAGQRIPWRDGKVDSKKHDACQSIGGHHYIIDLFFRVGPDLTANSFCQVEITGSSVSGPSRLTTVTGRSGSPVISVSRTSQVSAFFTQ